MEEIGDDVGGEGLDHRVEIANRAIVIAPRHLDFILDTGEFILEIAKIGVFISLCFPDESAKRRKDALSSRGYNG